MEIHGIIASVLGSEDGLSLSAVSLDFLKVYPLKHIKVRRRPWNCTVFDTLAMQSLFRRRLASVEELKGINDLSIMEALVDAIKKGSCKKLKCLSISFGGKNYV